MGQQASWLLIGYTRVNNQSEARSVSWPNSWQWRQLINFRFRLVTWLRKQGFSHIFLVTWWRTALEKKKIREEVKFWIYFYVSLEKFLKFSNRESGTYMHKAFKAQWFNHNISLQYLYAKYCNPHEIMQSSILILNGLAQTNWKHQKMFSSSTFLFIQIFA